MLEVAESRFGEPFGLLARKKQFLWEAEEAGEGTSLPAGANQDDE